MDATTRKIIYDLFQVGCATIILRRVNDQIAFAVYVEVPGSPIFYAISFERVFNSRGHVSAVSCLSLVLMRAWIFASEAQLPLNPWPRQPKYLVGHYAGNLTEKAGSDNNYFFRARMLLNHLNVRKARFKC